MMTSLLALLLANVGNLFPRYAHNMFVSNNIANALLDCGMVFVLLFGFVLKALVVVLSHHNHQHYAIVIPPAKIQWFNQKNALPNFCQIYFNTVK